MHKITIIIPIYNVEKYLNKCIDSVVNQTYKNLEILLVDDGSTDASHAICDEWQIKDTRVKAIHKNNGGVSSARNIGLAAATGDYIVFIDSDDWVVDNFVETLYKSIIKNDADIAICEYLEINEDNKNISSQFNRVRLVDKTTTGKDLLKDLVFEKFCSVVVWNKIYKKSIFSNLRFKEGRFHEDEFIIHHILLKSKVVNCFSNPLYYYLIRSNSFMGEGFTVKRLDYLDALEDRANVAKEIYGDELYMKCLVWLINTCVSYFKKIKKSNQLNKEEIKFIFEKIRNYFDKYAKILLLSRYVSLKHKFRIIKYFLKIKFTEYFFIK